MEKSYYRRKMHIMLSIVLLVSLLPSAISASVAKETTVMPRQKPLPSLDTCVKLVLKNGLKNQANTKNSATKVAKRGSKNVGNTTTSADALMSCTEKSHQIAFAGAFAVPAAYEIATYLFVLFSSYCIANKDCRDVTQTIYGKVESTVGKMIAVGSIKWSDVGKKTSETLQYFKKLWTALQRENFDKNKINAIITAERKKANESISKTSTASTNAGTDVQIPSVSIDDLKGYFISQTSRKHVSERCLKELILNSQGKKLLELFHVSTRKPALSDQGAPVILVVLRIIGELECHILNYMGNTIAYKQSESSKNPTRKLTPSDVYSNYEKLKNIKIKGSDDPSMQVYLFLILSKNNNPSQIEGNSNILRRGFIRHAHLRNGEERAKEDIEHIRNRECLSLRIYPTYQEEIKYEDCKEQGNKKFEESSYQLTKKFLRNQ